MTAGLAGRGWRDAINSAVERWAFLLCCLLLVFSPLVRGGNRHVALALMEVLALLILLTLGAQYLCRDKRVRLDDPFEPRVLLLLASVPLVFGALQLVPIPLEPASHRPYLLALGLLGEARGSARAISLAPDATMLSLLAFLPVMAVTLMSNTAESSRLTHLIAVVMGTALIEALLGILQAGRVRFLFFGELPGRAVGSFANPNHYANYLAMCMPLVAMKVVIDPKGRNKSRRRGEGAAGDMEESNGKPHRRGGTRRSASHLTHRLAWGGALFLLTAGMLVSVSRAGILIALCCTALAVLLSPRPVSRSRGRRQMIVRWIRPAAVTAMLVLTVFAIGMEAVSSRFSDAQFSRASRLEIAKSALAAAMEFWPWGSGLGTFPSVFPRFQPSSLLEFDIQDAHNDYVQFFLEGGAAGLAFLAVGAWLLLSKGVHILRLRASRRSPGAAAVLQHFSGFALAAFLLHAAVDFPAHIPANLTLAAFFFGIVMRRTSSRSTDDGAKEAKMDRSDAPGPEGA